MNDPLISEFLPNPKGNQPLNRSYLFNIINSVKPEFFKRNITGAMKKRNELWHWKRNQYIEITPELHQLITNSKNIPRVSRGRALSLLKACGSKKRKRSKTKDKRTLEVHLDKVEGGDPTLSSIAKQEPEGGSIKRRKLNEKKFSLNPQQQE
mmetsp:Transcript_32309/g.23860  ORF Transcript_32309/g.23860 Transcript_32309/m.23860 type:complete len:152 (+) Transcript_32309:492-947(+)|eukprot:CAMPEP_0202979682 /NCGR_PEP_ID=MMETSP1396-20130829/85768_1 /ASSEMBLY_ACC=CAM_ASM_000872 /TAXON_ID= /ORGANISM="Pseudokeronopsis sp., Strain Brazil" /LENGTH=151 /DNA_ID=CAMNT_0049719227 /DNA_START=477 /DNA_END=932 /DNA_ORIENTATION=-